VISLFTSPLNFQDSLLVIGAIPVQQKNFFAAVTFSAVLNKIFQLRNCPFLKSDQTYAFNRASSKEKNVYLHLNEDLNITDLSIFLTKKAVICTL
jgi:hypothetical protein